MNEYKRHLKLFTFTEFYSEKNLLARVESWREAHPHLVVAVIAGVDEAIQRDF